MTDFRDMIGELPEDVREYTEKYALGVPHNTLAEQAGISPKAAVRRFRDPMVAELGTRLADVVMEVQLDGDSLAGIEDRVRDIGRALSPQSLRLVTALSELDDVSDADAAVVQIAASQDLEVPVVRRRLRDACDDMGMPGLYTPQNVHVASGIGVTFTEWAYDYSAIPHAHDAVVHRGLSDRRREVLDGYVRNQPTDHIAELLGLPDATVDADVAFAVKAFSAADRMELVIDHGHTVFTQDELRGLATMYRERHLFPQEAEAASIIATTRSTDHLSESQMSAARRALERFDLAEFGFGDGSRNLATLGLLHRIAADHERWLLTPAAAHEAREDGMEPTDPLLSHYVAAAHHDVLDVLADGTPARLVAERYGSSPGEGLVHLRGIEVILGTSIEAPEVPEIAALAIEALRGHQQFDA